MKFTEYRIGVRLRTNADNEQFKEYSLIEVFYEFDTYNPLYDKIYESLLKADMSEEKQQELIDKLPMQIVSYTETNALRGWDVLQHLYEEYNDINEAFSLPLINLDDFPKEIENELSIAKTEQAAKEITGMSDEKFSGNIKIIKEKVKKQKVSKTLKKKTVIKNIKKKNKSKNTKK